MNARWKITQKEKISPWRSEDSEEKDKRINHKKGGLA